MRKLSFGFLNPGPRLASRPYSPSVPERQTDQSRKEILMAEMMTIAWALGKSSVIDKSMRTS
jgi:hypothetical protein